MLPVIMPNCVIFYHMLVNLAGGLQNFHGGITDEFEPEIVNLVCNSYAYTGANPAGTSRIQHPPNTRVIEATKRHLGNRVVSPLLTIRKKYKKKGEQVWPR